MREIKFRIWDNLSGGFVQDKLNGFEDVWFNEQFKSKDLTFLQYTGLKDKNGKEIYEGDIVSDGYHNGEIDWKGNVYCHDYYEMAGSTYHYMIPTGGCEIIGNIYENPDKLK